MLINMIKKGVNSMKLTGEMKQLLMMCASAMIIFVYIGIFVNLYIWERNHDLFDVAWYNIWMVFSSAFCYSYATKQLINHSIKTLVRLSAFFGAISFLLLSGFHPENELVGIVMYALPIGAMMGSYWGGMNIMLSVYGKGKEFVIFFSVFAIVGQIISISIPLLSAAIIELVGFIGSFLLMLIFVSLMFIMSFRIPNFTLKNVDERISFRKVFSFRNVATKRMKLMLKTTFFHGVVMMFQNLFVLIFTFQITENEWLIALLNIVYTFSSIIALKLFNQIQTISYKTWLRIGMTLISIGFICAIIGGSILLIISNICTTFGLFYVNTIIFSGQLSVLQNENISKKVSFLFWREWMFFISRFLVIGTLLFVDLSGPLFYILMTFVVICGFSIPSVFPNKNKSMKTKKAIA